MVAGPPSEASVVMVIDCGLDPTHPDLAPNLWVNPGEVAGNGEDDDGNGYVDDVHGYGFNVGSSDLGPAGCDHGTNVAGVTGARGDNGIGISGVAWKTKTHVAEAVVSPRTVTVRAPGLDACVLMALDVVFMHVSAPRAGEPWTQRATPGASESAGSVLRSHRRGHAETGVKLVTSA